MAIKCCFYLIGAEFVPDAIEQCDPALYIWDDLARRILNFKTGQWDEPMYDRGPNKDHLTRFGGPLKEAIRSVLVDQYRENFQPAEPEGN